MKAVSLYSRDQKHHNQFLLRRELNRFNLLANTASRFIYLIFATLSILLCFHLIYYPNNIYTTTTAAATVTATTQHYTNQTSIHPRKVTDVEKCDLFKGEWIRDERGSLYTNQSCKTIPFKINCFLHGRQDRDFLNWRWKPDKCKLPRFNPEAFLATVQGKTMAFVGDSLAKNQMESLLCLLSTVEAPMAMHKEPDDKFPTWIFPKHNFTLMAFWSAFLVTAQERVVNGSATGGFDLHLDKIDASWSEKLPSFDFAVFSAAHWFFRQNYLYEDGKLVGCVYCQAPNVTDLGPGRAIKAAFRAAFKAINECKNCKKISTFLRTYSPSHFENGTWNTGGVCNRTRPFGREEINKDGPDFEYRKIQGEEVEIARNAGEGNGNTFEIIDVTEIMSMRVDGHPGEHWGNRWMKGYSDCIHWCLPGPIDAWNELMFELIKRHEVDARS